MPQKQFELTRCRNEVLSAEEGGGHVMLTFTAPNLPALLNESLPAALAVADELAKEIESALSAETAATRELSAARAELAEAEGRVALLSARPQSAQAEREAAIERGDLARADAMAAELSALPGQLQNAEQRLRRLRQDARVHFAEQAVKSERAAIETRIRDAKRAELEPKMREAERKLAAAVERCWRELAEAEALMSACSDKPTKRFHKIGAAETAALERKLAEENAARAAAAAAARESEPHVKERREREAAWNERESQKNAQEKYRQETPGWWWGVFGRNQTGAA